MGLCCTVSLAAFRDYDDDGYKEEEEEEEVADAECFAI